MLNGPQQPGGIRGSNPLIYTGSTPNMVTMNRRPNATDYQQYFIGHWWIIPIDDTFTTGEVWTLVSKDNGIATWKKLHGGGGPVPPASTKLVNIIYLMTAGAGVYIPTLGMSQVTIECIGGAGSGNTQAAAFTNYAGNNWYLNSPGGGGAYSRKTYTSDQIGSSQSYFIGAGGIAPASGTQNGVDGQDTTFGSGSLLITAGGGGGGIIPTGTPPPGRVNEGGLGGEASGGDLNVDGTDGAMFYGEFPGAVPVRIIANASAGNSFYGVGAYSIASSTTPVTGVNGSQGAGGGSVVLVVPTAGQVVGGNGGDGLIIITEYLG